MRREKVKHWERSDLDRGVYHTRVLRLHPAAQYINFSADTHVRWITPTGTTKYNTNYCGGPLHHEPASY